MNYTKEKWQCGSFNDEPFARSCLSIYGEDGRRIAEVSREGFMRLEEAGANADLISAAVNGCISVNPDNPQGVADSIKDMYEALREIKQIVSGCAFEEKVTEQIIAGKCFLALSKAEGK